MSFGIGMNFGPVGETVTIDRPSTGEVEGVQLGDDLDIVIAKATAETSRLLVSIRSCLHSPAADIELDSVSGLLLVSGVESPTAGDGSVVWTDAETVTVHIAAAAFKHLRPHSYFLALEEITAAGRRLHRHDRELIVMRTGGGLR